MPSIKDSRKIIKTTAPSIEGSEVILYDDLTGGDATRISSLGALSPQEKSQQILLSLIKSWNLDEELNLESVGLLSIDDTQHLLEQTSFYGRGLDEDGKVKKNLIIEENSKA